MTETTELPTSTTGRTARGAGLSGMVLADLKVLAGQLGIKGTSGMRKGDLVAAIASRQAGASASAPSTASSAPTRSGAVNGDGGANGAREPHGAGTQTTGNGPAADAAGGPAAGGSAVPDRRRRVATRRAGAPDTQPALTDLTPQTTTPDRAAGDAVQVNGSAGRADAGRTDAHQGTDGSDRGARPDGARTDATDQDRGGDARDGSRPDDARDGSRPEHGRRNRRNRRDRGDGGDGAAEQAVRTDADSAAPRDGQARDGQTREDRNGQARDGQARDGQAREDRNGQARDGQSDRQGDGQGGGQQGRHGDNRRDDDDGDGGRRRGRRFRDRNRRGRERYSDSNEPEIREDDVLVPVGGIVDVLDSYAFVRTNGYLAGPNDVYVSLSQVRKYGLRRGDQITGAIRAPREGEQPQQRQKFNPLVRLDTINGLEPDTARHRPEFTKLTPLYPNERLRLETDPHILTTRVIDLVMPVGKGQRALIVSPPKAGKTSVLQAIANAITTNNPECHLMVVLVDERPEEVTDMQRSVKGEVIASTFDRPPSDHTMVAELSIERAKRLVEM
ncbi:MAG TPA: Rho termination factor N-terminal domain-containing protein, partial [Nakamurella sp.]|nr:Rho termination factor N-terminal domain-containing protein [Nakamurella sp.]